MNLVNEFTVSLPIDEAWALLTDVEKIAPCMPGASLTGFDGRVFTGTIKVKVGPVFSLFEGTAIFSEKNEAEHRVVFAVNGQDTKGNGFAAGTITATIVSGGGNKSTVKFVTDVTLTGRMAGFGRQVMTDVSNKLFSQFAECVERDLHG